MSTPQRYPVSHIRIPLTRSSDTETDSDPDPDFASPLTFSDYLQVENATASSAGGSPNPDGKAGS
ncbi:MAG: hypothetical protein ACOX52_07230 [Verrucomicrobiota bacterium]